MHLPHQAVIHQDHGSTKIHIAFDASTEKVGPSLNDAIYKESCLDLLLSDVLAQFQLNPIGIIAGI